MPKIYTFLFGFSMALTVAAVVALSLYGLNFGVDFKGGSVLELQFAARPSTEDLTTALARTNVEAVREATISQVGTDGVIIRTGELSEDEHQKVLTTVRQSFPNAAVSEKRFDSIGPAVGKELRNKSLIAIVIVLLTIITYIALVFRKLSRTLSLWVMNVATVLGLLHDIIVPMGIFAILGHFQGVQISAVFVAAILTILGYTVSDKVVIFDRVRENILRGTQGSLGQIVHLSVKQTLVRSINNTLTVLLSSLAIYLFGGESIRYFALALLLGIALGAFSSISMAAPLLVWWSGRSQKAQNLT